MKYDSFDDKAVQEILSDALKARQKSEILQEDTGSTSIQELVSIGCELGIPADAIEDAMIRRFYKRARRFWGAPLVLDLKFHESGAVSPATLAEIAAQLSYITGQEGSVMVTDAGAFWKSRLAVNQGSDPVEIRLMVLQDGTSIAIKARNYVAAVGLYGGLVGGLGIGAGIGVGVGVGIGALASPFFALTIPVLCIGGSILLARAIFSRYGRHQLEKCKAVAGKIRTLLAQKKTGRP